MTLISSTATSRVSIAKSLVLPSRTGASYLRGQAFVKLHLMTGFLASSRRVTVTAAVVLLPEPREEHQSQRAVESTRPRLRTRFPDFAIPRSLRTCLWAPAPPPEFEGLDGGGRQGALRKGRCGDAGDLDQEVERAAGFALPEDRDYYAEQGGTLAT
jgi:hypothetical protein